MRKWHETGGASAGKSVFTMSVAHLCVSLKAGDHS